MQNLFANLPNSLPAELTTVLAESAHIRIERIVSTGQSSPAGYWYDQEEHEWVVLLTGEASLRFEEGETLIMKPGDAVLIPAHRRHRVDSTALDQPTVWLAVFYSS